MAHRNQAKKTTRRAPTAPCAPRIDTFPLTQAQQLYLEQQLTCPQIAKQLGCAISTVQRRLKAAGTPMRDDRHHHSGGRNAKTTADDNPHLRDQVIARYQAGESTTTIADDLNHSAKQVNSVLRRAGIPIRPSAHIGRPITDTDRHHAIQLYTDGRSIQHIARQLHVKTTRIRSALTDAGIPIRSKGASTAIGERIAALGVTAHHIKTWAHHNGHLDQVRPGILSRAVLEAYETAHPTTEGAHQK